MPRQDCEDIAYDGLRMAIYAIIRYKWHICDIYTAAGDGRWRPPSATSIMQLRSHFARQTIARVLATNAGGRLSAGDAVNAAAAAAVRPQPRHLRLGPARHVAVSTRTRVLARSGDVHGASERLERAWVGAASAEHA